MRRHSSPPCDACPRGLNRTTARQEARFGGLFFMAKIYELRATSYELQKTSYELRAASFPDDAPTSARYARKSHVTPPCFVPARATPKGFEGLVVWVGDCLGGLCSPPLTFCCEPLPPYLCPTPRTTPAPQGARCVRKNARMCARLSRADTPVCACYAFRCACAYVPMYMLSPLQK